MMPPLQLELKYVLFAFLAGFALTIDAQDQTGFISIDFGLQANVSSYVEEDTGFNYTSDEKLIDTGESKMVAKEYKENIQQQYWSLRSFPEGDKNCYKIEVTVDTKYLIRAIFYYGNYDGQDMPPVFDLYLGASLWDSISTIDTKAKFIYGEIIHVTQKSHVHVCLVNKGHGVPFISALELRPLDDLAYPTERGSLAWFDRCDTGARFSKYDDVYDRLWAFEENDPWKDISTNRTVESGGSLDPYKIPSPIMSTAVTPKYEDSSLDIWWGPEGIDANSSYYFYLHFAEIERLQPNESREFDIFYNGHHFHGPLSPIYLERTTVSTPPFQGSYHNFSFLQTGNSTLPPLLNAYEIYTAKEFSQLESDEQDVDAVTKLKSAYGLRRNWQGDPCSPKEYSWEGLTCSYEDNTPRIVSLNLSPSELRGEIPAFITNLTMLQILDLSNNNFTGSVPEFLSQLPKLTILNLENNDLNGLLPAKLIEKWKTGFLSLSVSGNPNLCASVSCKKKNSVVPVVLASALVGTFLLLLAAIWWGLRRKSQQGSSKAKSTSGQYTLESRKRQFAYSDIQRITNNFERILGKGGFGTVYHGQIDDTQVVVKMLSPSSIQGYQQFQAEVNILLRVHHKNLTTLVGYFTDDQNNAGLVYEYMNNGDLQSHLLDHSSTNILKWEDRLHIAIDAAQGLEYLHQGCKPSIIHRDVKSANILLNESFQAKLSDFGISDFGISRTFPTDCNGQTHVSTVVAGTPGYIDPEYYQSNKLTTKSDVYSFEMVLLEIITRRLIMSKPHESMGLREWVLLMLEKGHINGIMDPRLQGNFNVNTAWKVVEVAVNCVSPNSAKRPTMSQVVGELKECLEIANVEKTKEMPLDLISDDVFTQPFAR